MSDIAERRTGFGEVLRRDRLAAGLTQEELAETSGLSARAISDMERGRTARPRPSTLRRLSKALDTSAPDHQAFTAALWRPVAQLPADVADFTGRSDQVERLASLITQGKDGLAPGAVAVAAVAGVGGIGKTSLAVHTAHQVASRFPDAQLYLNLRGCGSQPVPPGEALARFLRDLGADPAAMPADEGERAGCYRSLLAGRRALIILDDARDAAQVRPLLPGSAGCIVIVTSRRSLPDLESAQLMDLDIMSDGEAQTLFARIVGPARAAAEPDAVSRVLAACGGLPLAIRIAAARLAARPDWSIAALAARLGDTSRRLDELQVGDLAVRAGFVVSYAKMRAAAGQVSDAPDRAFRMLALAEGPDISLHAGAATLGVPTDRAEQALEQLVDAHLLRAAGPGRYRFHGLMRVYAGERSRAEDDRADRDEAVRRMLQWYLHTAIAATRLIHPYRLRHLPLKPAHPSTAPLAFETYAEALAWIESEYANLVAAVGQAAKQGEHDLAWKLPATLSQFFYLRGNVADWIASHQIGLSSARLLSDRTGEGWLLNNLGLAWVHAKRPEAAIDFLRQCHALAQDEGNMPAVVVALSNLGVALEDVGRCDEAMQPLRRSLCLSQRTGNRIHEGIALKAIGRAYRQSGQFIDAIAHYERSLTASRETRDLITEGATLVELSTVRLKLGQMDEAIREIAGAVELNRQTGNRYGQARAMAVLGRIERDRGSLAHAREHWLNAVTIFTELGLPQASRVGADLSALDT